VKSFTVPIARADGPEEKVSSGAEALVCPSDAGSRFNEPHEVERAPLKLHNSKDEYIVYKSYTFSKEDYIWFRAPLTKIGRISPGTPIIMKVNTSRPQMVYFQGGHWHAILTFYWDDDHRMSLNFACGDYNRRVGPDEVKVESVPTCPECLAEEWLPFVVLQYERPEITRKAQEKVLAERRFRAGIPTRFDRIYDADQPEPEPEEPMVLEPDLLEPDLEEPMGRESKLTARIRHQRHIEAAIRRKHT